MHRILSFFLVAMVLFLSGGCVESVTRIHDRSEGDKALYLEHDPAAAQVYYQKAARAGDAESQHQLAIMYLTGNGVPKNIASFRDMEEMSAAQEYPPAMRNLGFVLVTGLYGIQPDPRRGMSLLKAAADEDDADAHYMLGRIYARGVPGVQKNPAMATYHYGLAEENGIYVDPEKQKAVLTVRSKYRHYTPTRRAGARQTGVKYDLTTLETRKFVQQSLKKLGYYSMGIDGAIGKGSAKAIRAYQKDAGLKPTGNITEQLIDSLLASTAKK